MQTSVTRSELIAPPELAVKPFAVLKTIYLHLSRAGFRRLPSARLLSQNYSKTAGLVCDQFETSRKRCIHTTYSSETFLKFSNTSTTNHVHNNHFLPSNT